MTGYFYKVLAIMLMVALVATGGGWWLAAHDRDQVLVDLKAERGVSEQLRAGIREQNRAVEAMARAKEDADARGALAQQLAAANGKRFDGALAKIAGAKATTCTDAMPAVNELLKGIR